MKICQAVIKLWSGHKNCKHTKGNNCKSLKTRVTVLVFFMSSIEFNVCVKFHENMSRGFKVMERTRKLLIHKKGNNSKSRKTRVTVLVFCTLSYGV